MSTKRHSFIWLVLALSGCAGEISEEPVLVEDPVSQGLLARDWVGFKVNAKMPEFYDTGVVEVASEQTPPSSAPYEATQLPEHLAEARDEDLWEMVDFESNHRYVVHMTSDAEKVGRWVTESIHAQEVFEPDVLENLTINKSVVGTDKRERMGIADGYPKSGSYLQTIGRTALGCSGTLVAQNLMLTAAHCVFNNGVAADYNFYPRRDGTSATPTPWGTWVSRGVFYPQQFVTSKCHSNYADTTCSKWDIALVKVTKPANLAGWNASWEMAYAYETRNQLDTRTLRNYGYPDCGSPGKPQPCTNYTLYRDADKCALGISQVAPINGTDYQVATQHGCDTSPGHSGSAIFYFRTNARPMIVGVNVSHDSAVVGLGTPNWFRRITPDIVNWINANRI